jgi:signal transduction histidine kinase
MNTILREILRPSLATLFLRYFLTALLALLLIISGVGIVIDQLYNSVDEDNGRSFMRGTVTLIDSELLRLPEAQWSQALARLAPSFTYKIALTDLSHLQALDDSQRQDISRGIAQLDMDDLMVYSRIGDSQRVLVLGPLNFRPNDSDSLLTSGSHANALWWTLTGLGLALMIFLALRPLWADLLALRATTERLAGGHLDERAPRARSWLLSPLMQGINAMAERMQIQMNAQQALSRAVVHELRTPIARLRFGLNMLSEAETGQDTQKYQQSMERDMQELDDLVNASMSYSQLNQGEVTLQWEHTELHDWFAELLEMVRPLAPTGMRLQMTCPRADAEFDRKLVYVAARNLLVNALRFARSSVRLTIDKQDGWFEVQVDDDGPGVPPAERERIFDPFHRLDHPRDQPNGSYGLGLSFVRLIAEQHGGGVQVGDSPDGGARFVIHIPTHDGGEENL